MPPADSNASGTGTPASSRVPAAVAAIAFLATFALTVRAVVAACDAVGAMPGLLRLNAAAQIANRTRRVEDEREDLRVFLLGDSTIQLFEDSDGIPEYIAQSWYRKAAPDEELTLRTFSGPGLGPRVFYFLADELIDAEPDMVVWEVSFAHVSEHWCRNPIEDFCGWLDLTARPRELRTALDVSHITLDELLLNQALVRTGLMEPWRRLRNDQSRAAKLREIAAEALDRGRRPGAEKAFQIAAANAARARFDRPGHPDRFNLRGARQHFGVALRGVPPDHPVLRLVGATVRRFREAGIEVIVYLNPVNVEDLRGSGALEEGAFEAGAEAFRSVVEAEGAMFLDLHDLFADRYFIDSAGHFVQRRDTRGAEELAGALTSAIRRGLEARELRN